MLSAEEQGVDDDISEPDEDTFEGQMALMKGGSVKNTFGQEESDDESERATQERKGEGRKEWNDAVQQRNLAAFYTPLGGP